MVENVFCILCKDILEDSRTRLVSYINCFEEMVTKKLPGNAPPFCIGTLWRKTTEGIENFKVKISLSDSSGTQRVLLESQDIAMKDKSHRLNLLLEGLPVTQEGKHKFIIELLYGGNWVLIKELYLTIRIER
jgi:hypothetical protein